MTVCSGLVEEGGFEPPKLTQQIYSLPPLATRELLHMKLWSWWTDSNPRPADYKSAALPAELHQHLRFLSSSKWYFTKGTVTCQADFKKTFPGRPFLCSKDYRTWI